MRRHLMIGLAGAALAVPAAAGTLAANHTARIAAAATARTDAHDALRAGTDGKRLGPPAAAGMPDHAVATTVATGVVTDVITAVRDTVLRYRFPARAGVCGSGSQIWTTEENGRRSYYNSGRRGPDEGDERVCEHGPVHAVLRQQDGRITDVTVRVGTARPGGGWVDLSAVAAVDVLLAESLLQRTDRRAARDLVFATVLADAPSWPRLLQIARSRAADDDVRKGAIFWLGQTAGDRAVAGLVAVAGDDEDDLSVREAAVFSLYQMRDSVGIEPLIEIARTHSQPRIRRSAMFWLGQSGHPRALEFFESVLRG
jgi:hypothetical protein